MQFRPEFLNRLDEIVFYRPLTRSDITNILKLMFADLQKRLDAQKLTLEVTDAACDYIIENGFEPIYGARPLRRFIQSKVETLVGRLIIAEAPAEKSVIIVDLKDGALHASVK